jgi:hypothetical protein
LGVATEQGEKYRYATEIPLVEPNEQRIKLARLAVAAAALFFSTDESGETVIVKKEHVDFVASFLERLYCKPSLAFDEYARQQTSQHEIGQPDVVAELIRKKANAGRHFMQQERFTQRDIQEILGINDRDDLRDAITKLRDTSFLKREGSNFYVKTTAAVRWLRQEISGAASTLNTGSLSGQSRINGAGHGNGNGASDQGYASVYHSLPETPDF